MTDDRHTRGSRGYPRSLSGRPRKHPQSRQQDRRVPRGSVDTGTILEDIGETTEYAFYENPYGYQNTSVEYSTYTQSSVNMTAIPVTSPSLTPTEAGYSGAPPTTPLYTHISFPLSPSAGSQAEGDTGVPAYEPSSTNSDPPLPNGSSNYCSGSESQVISHPTVAASTDAWNGPYPTYPSSSVSYSSIAFTSSDAGPHTQSPPYTQVGDTSFANLYTSMAPSPSNLGATNDENITIGRDDVSDQEQSPYGHQGYRRGSGESMENNNGSAVNLVDQTPQDPDLPPGGEHAHLSSEELRQAAITEYVSDQSPWSSVNLSNGSHGTNVSSAHDDITSSSYFDFQQ
ncbi:hypothetical protein F5Y13DRAFT_202908 [Hypoxylon sp. FL1857]|nr:hypothetical protein F5Y13DRAFT_202908 [Hypoxylon sp. FL1857]